MSDITTTQPHELELTQILPLDQNPAAVYLAHLAPSSRRPQRQALNRIAHILGAVDCFTVNWSALRYQHTAAIRAQLLDTCAAATANRILSALRGVLRQAWKLNQITAEEYQRAADLESVTGSTLPAGRELSAGELSALLANCQNDQSPAGVRDAAIIAMLYAAGLRRAELAGLDLSNYDQVTGRLVLVGKRNKERTAYLINGAADALAEWLQLRGGGVGPLFMAINKSGALQAHGMTSQAIYNLLAKRAHLAGVASFSPHDMRRTFVSDLLEAGADIATVAKMAGHASVVTTARYDRRPEQAKQKAAGLLHVPFRRRDIK